MFVHRLYLVAFHCLDSDDQQLQSCKWAQIKKTKNKTTEIENNKRKNLIFVFTDCDVGWLPSIDDAWRFDCLLAQLINKRVLNSNSQQTVKMCPIRFSFTFLFFDCPIRLTNSFHGFRSSVIVSITVCCATRREFLYFEACFVFPFVSFLDFRKVCFSTWCSGDGDYGAHIYYSILCEAMPNID